MDMEVDYLWSLTTPDETLMVKFFDATMNLQRQKITGRSLAGVLLRYPLMTGRIVLWIYWEALTSPPASRPRVARPS
jgi:DUF1365 family protein